MNSNTRSNFYMLFLLFYTLLLSFGLAIFVPNASQFLPVDKSYLLVLLLVSSQFLTSILPLFIYLFVTKQKLKDVIPLKLISLKNVFLIAVICIFIQPIMLLLSFLSSFFSNDDVGDLLAQMTALPFYVTLFTVAVVPAIFEEITFRGIILSGYKNIPLKTAFFINGLFFGIMHLAFQQFFYAVLLGIVFSYFVHYTKSIFSSMIGHFVINGSQVLSLYFISSIPLDDTTKVTTPMLIAQFVFLVVLSCITFPVLYYAFLAFKKHNKIDDDKGFNNEKEIELNIDTTTEKKSNIYNLSFFAVVLFYIVYMAFMVFTGN